MLEVGARAFMNNAKMVHVLLGVSVPIVILSYRVEFQEVE